MKLIPDQPVTFGDEEGDFHIHQVHRTKPFGRVNHFHPTYEIYYLRSGERVHFIDRRTVRLVAGDLVLVNKGVVHNASDIGPPEHERIVVNFSDAFLGAGHPLHDPLLLGPFAHQACVLKLSSQERVFVEQLLAKLVAEAAQRRPGREVYLRVLLTELLLFAARHPIDDRPEDGGQRDSLHRKITEVAAFIGGSFATKLTLPDLAGRFFVSPYYLSRSFKAVTGFTLIEYVNLTRVREAQRLLRETNLKVISVAEQTGFESAGHFDRMFKKLTGTTPLLYRKLNRL
ncbi:helix-turn-helix transcriptional regulator [Paenibacillus sacheonensis]|uniref:Helix-turn-helix domain-containing protein n=1 Tax=Paenibacillus sacheonensis TaxID=742054 RepID=A0A7X4YPC8_9BACL|nr:AraC family transcriptional regulator [Paenibacillus sacheonensis]MBM7565211.1 AraC-like DNA-binding protein [Paenibacillus sacheonensis]NBC70013.1 helix-turn-helix domain-containing protein [Paenibacillus sacheonensis]